eukprot:CAMPEP_0172455582 /NCGR_PEP_ID=MMETSP1065-20121228/12139_1 /TAXON_ID=265537 /ORGANISM="Amphiprora paludosa, Strain CCMP125" /LENGTH=277 /DNA_ID=CAMNT_0013208047 /DNA_START=227 /DNA_END=1060 /DNA_ORIENTATION=+
MNQASSDDPFYVFREEMQRKLENVDERLEILKRVAQEGPQPHQDNKTYTLRLKESKKELKKALKDAEFTLGDLETCVNLMQESTQFSEAEIYQRTSLVQSCRQRVHQAKQGMNQVVPSSGMSGLRRGHSTGTTSDNNDASVGLLASQEDHHPSSSTSSNNYRNMDHGGNANGSNNNNNSQQQRSSLLLMKHQDETLDELDAAVTRVGYMADTIHEEIGDQNKMLADMETDLEVAEEQLGTVMGKLSDFLQTKDQFQLCTILALFAVAVVLLVLVIYT